MRAGDRAIGIVLGVLLALAIIVGFVFFGSGDTIDAPDISGGAAEQQQPAEPQQGQPGEPSP